MRALAWISRESTAITGPYRKEAGQRCRDGSRDCSGTLRMRVVLEDAKGKQAEELNGNVVLQMSELQASKIDNSV